MIKRKLQLLNLTTVSLSAALALFAALRISVVSRHEQEHSFQARFETLRARIKASKCSMMLDEKSFLAFANCDLMIGFCRKFDDGAVCHWNVRREMGALKALGL
jgi:hypothetical protein